MPEVTVGVGRIKIPYTVNGLDHELHMYVSNPTLSGATWEIGINPTFGGTSNWATAAQGLADHMSYALGTGTTPGTALLQEWSTTGWITHTSASVTFPNVSGSQILATQITVTLRALDNSRPKIVLMEGNQAAPFHTLSPTGGAGGMDSFIDGFLGTSLTAARPWFYMVTMHGIFLNVSSFVAVTTTYNRTMRKARGLA